VLGGGCDGSEYAATFAALGCKVTHADPLDRPLAFSIGAHGVLRRGAAPQWRRIHSARRSDSHALGRRLAGAHRIQGRPQHQADKVLVALGRLANVDGLNLARWRRS
jgi:pyruvate/2-oxoglutarate dehydrogenase complex dihydrolipoamide dehydrogenase (E3) component